MDEFCHAMTSKVQLVYLEQEPVFVIPYILDCHYLYPVSGRCPDPAACLEDRRGAHWQLLEMDNRGKDSSLKEGNEK